MCARTIARAGFIAGFLLVAACANNPPPFVYVSPAYNPAQTRNVAVVGFKDYPGSPGSGDLVSSVFQSYILSLNYNLIERQQVQSVLNEQSFDLSGNVNIGTIEQMGKLLGADALILGSITSYADASEQTIMVDVPQENFAPVFGGGAAIGPFGAYAATSGVIPYETTTSIPETQTLPAQIGISARLVSVKTGSVLWSGAAVRDGSNISAAAQNASRAIVDDLKKNMAKMGL
ncbi:MAG: CsgG/HfaB family protein [Elusimicrobiota bacterium]